MDQRTSTKRVELLALEAADWVARDQLENPTERAQFERWLMESPAHVREFLAAQAAKDLMAENLDGSQMDVDELLQASTNVVHIPAERPPITRQLLHAPSWTRRTRMIFGTAASVLIFVAVSLFVANVWLRQVYTTSVGEQRSVALPDGSVVVMNTQSTIRVDYSDQTREVHLRRGQAMFTVAHDATRPFRVNVDGAVVQAIGTRFDVRRMPDRTRVAVLEGRVRVSAAAHKPSATVPGITAGQGVSIFETGKVTSPTPIDMTEATAWQQRRLIFVDDTLADIIAEFGRYTRMRIRIEGDGIGDLRFSGVWDADRPDLLLAYLKTHRNISVERDAQEGYVLRSRAAPPKE